MKKTNTKLQLRSTTIRILQDDELSSAVGGRRRSTFTTCSQQMGCSHPPQHPPGSGNNGNNGNNGN